MMSPTRKRVQLKNPIVDKKRFVSDLYCLQVVTTSWS